MANANLTATMTVLVEPVIVLTHGTPQLGETTTPCCGKSVFELPHNDKITIQLRMVTCGRV